VHLWCAEKGRNVERRRRQVCQVFCSPILIGARGQYSRITKSKSVDSSIDRPALIVRSDSSTGPMVFWHQQPPLQLLTWLQHCIWYACIKRHRLMTSSATWHEGRPNKKPSCRWDSRPYWLVIGNSRLSIVISDCCYIAHLQLFSRYWDLSVFGSCVWPFGVTTRVTIWFPHRSFPIDGPLEPRLYLYRPNGFRDIQRRMWCNGWRDLNQSLNEGQGHSLEYTNRFSYTTTNMLSIVTFAIGRTV